MGGGGLDGGLRYYSETSVHDNNTFILIKDCIFQISFDSSHSSVFTSIKKHMHLNYKLACTIRA